MDFKKEAELLKFKDKIFKYIAVRKKTVREVYNKFKNDDYAKLYLDEAIEYFKEVGYLDDDKFAKLFIEDYINFKSNSAFEVRMKLIQKGIDKNIIDDKFNFFEDELNDMEIKNITKVLKTKKNQEEIKVKNYLYRKGFKSKNILIALEDYKYENEED